MHRADTHAPAVTIVPSGRSLSFNELDDQAGRFASALEALGLSEGDRVAFLLDNQLEYPVVLLGAQLGGYDHLPLNTHTSDEDLLQIIKQFDPAVVIVAAMYRPRVEQLTTLMPQIRWVGVGIHESDTWLSYERLLQNSLGELRRRDRTGKLLLLSGGSTGRPKIVERPHAGAVETPRQSVALAYLPLTAESVVLVSAPLYHTGPLGWTLGALERGAHVVLMENWDAMEQLRAIERYRVTLMPLVPTIMSRLLALPEEARKRFDLSSLVAISHSAAPCSIELKRAFMDWLPQVWSGYSMTEGFGLCVISPEEWLHHPGSVGRPVEWCSITIRDKQGHDLPRGEVGIVWFKRHDGLRMQYLGNSEEVAKSYNVHGEGSSFDLGYLDDDGYLYLVGRDKDMIIVGGVNIFPTRIQDVLTRHPAVVDACVVGRPHHDFGEVPVAVLELGAGHTLSSGLMKELTDSCHVTLGRLATPTKLVAVPRIPRANTGKIRPADIHALIDAH